MYTFIQQMHYFLDRNNFKLYNKCISNKGCSSECSVQRIMKKNVSRFPGKKKKERINSITVSTIDNKKEKSAY